ncbi:MotA/TolQ/ExbB proton channel family protein [Ferrovum sp.]|uniref:MotA/TolQ/ExbB proton channel family protein n=2 Tax=Ferrovum sp. TaxID=2609467 RepID=UPI0026374746|nr:MotA/TolQ/ExbB proton channel family protein [Ferrovum sp.]
MDFMQELIESWHALQLGGPTLYPLLGLALMALVILIDRTWIFFRFIRLPRSLDQLVSTYGFTWESLDEEIHRSGESNYYSRFCRNILDHRTRPLWWIESRAQDQAQILEKGMGRGLWVLETIVTAAPLLGLLGTITGMMHAFNLIGGNGLVDPSGVTGGVAQALIATAVGIFIALIALFGFNYFSRQQTHALEEMERLGTHLLDNLRLGYEFPVPERESP